MVYRTIANINKNMLAYCHQGPQILPNGNFHLFIEESELLNLPRLTSKLESKKCN